LFAQRNDQLQINKILNACLERRNFTEILYEFHRKQFNFTEKTQEWRKNPVFQMGPKYRGIYTPYSRKHDEFNDDLLVLCAHDRAL